LHEDRQLAAGNLARLESVAGDEIGIGRRRQPARVAGGVGVDAGKSFGDETHQRAGEIAGHGGRRSRIYAPEDFAQPVFGRDQNLPQAP